MHPQAKEVETDTLLPLRAITAGKARSKHRGPLEARVSRREEGEARLSGGGSPEQGLL